jgi:hypothetical protein
MSIFKYGGIYKISIWIKRYVFKCAGKFYQKISRINVKWKQYQREGNYIGKYRIINAKIIIFWLEIYRYIIGLYILNLINIFRIY